MLYLRTFSATYTLKVCHTSSGTAFCGRRSKMPQLPYKLSGRCPDTPQGASSLTSYAGRCPAPTLAEGQGKQAAACSPSNRVLRCKLRKSCPDARASSVLSLAQQFTLLLIRYRWNAARKSHSLVALPPSTSLQRITSM